MLDYEFHLHTYNLSVEPKSGKKIEIYIHVNQYLQTRTTKKNYTSTQLKCNEVKLLQSVISLYRVSHGKVYKVILI